MNNKNKIMLGIAAGLAAGAILGVLFAPDKGTETRKKLKKKGKQMSQDLKETFEKGKEKLNDLKEELEKTVKEKVEAFN